MRIPTDREPTHPGEMLQQEFLLPLGMTQRDLATAIRVPYQRVNEVVRKRRGVTPSTALRLSKFLGTSPDFWMSLQLRWDLYHAQRAEAQQIDSIRPHELINIRRRLSNLRRSVRLERIKRSETLRARIFPRLQVEDVLPTTVSTENYRQGGRLVSLGPLPVYVPRRVIPVTQVSPLDMMVRDNL